MLPEFQVLFVLHHGHDGPVHRPRVGGGGDVQLLEGPAPLLDQQLEPVPAAGADAAAGHVQVLHVPAGQPHQGRVGDALAVPDVEDAQLGGPLEDPLDLVVVHAVVVAALVHADGQLLEVGEGGGGDLLADRRLVEAEHGVGCAEPGELGAALGQLLNVDHDGVAGGGGDVGHVQAAQVLGMLLQKSWSENQPEIHHNSLQLFHIIYFFLANILS